MSDTWTRGHTPDTGRICVRYATWRIVDHIVGQPLRIRLGHGLTRLGHGSIVLINDFNSQQRKKEERERRWKAMEFRCFQDSGRREKGEERKMRIGMGVGVTRRGWVLGEEGESRGGGRE